jgi:hypothetical protein
VPIAKLLLFSSVADLDRNLDPYHFPGSVSGSVSFSNEEKKITGKENLTKYVFWLGPGGPTDKENQVKMYKNYCFRYITFLKR